jgi:hypothetical protein
MKKILAFAFLAFLFSFSVALAQSGNAVNGGGNQGNAVNGTEPINITNPLNVDSPQLLIGRVINSILGVVGSLALVMFVYGGLIWMTSSGSSDQVKKGKDILIWAAIGLVIIFSAYGIIRFVIQGVGA